MNANHHHGHNCQIYLSHSGHSHDIQLAGDLYKQLRSILHDRPSCAIFWDRSVATDPAGQAVWDAALDTCRVGVLLISPNFLSSNRAMRELQRLVERSRDTTTLTLHPIFYDIVKEIDNECLRSDTAALDKWGSMWRAFGDEVDTMKWARYVVEMRKMSWEMLFPNNIRPLSIARIGRTIVRSLPPTLRPTLLSPTPMPMPRSQQPRIHGSHAPPSTSGQMNQKAVGRIVKHAAQCRYTTLGSLERATTHVSFYLQPIGYDDLHDNQRHKPGLLGQRPECGAPNEILMVETLMFGNVKEAGAYTLPIGAGKEWWELIWTDHGGGSGNVVYGNDHSCWCVKAGKIPRGFVCLSPCFFKIDTLADRRDDKSLFGESSVILKRDYRPPSSDDVRGMVAVRKDLVTYVSGKSLMKVWDESGSGVAESLAIYTGPDSCGCFAFTTKNPWTKDACYPILKRSIFG